MGTWLSQFWAGLSNDFLDLPDGTQAGQIVGRVIVAGLLGAVLGYERERKGKAAGVKTHIIIALAAALFVIVPQQSGFSPGDLSRIVQGVAAGVGFLGAGTILKPKDGSGNLVEGLTSAAGIYFTTAVGVAAGLGRDSTAILATGLALAVLTLTPKVQGWIERRMGVKQPDPPSSILLPSDTPTTPQNPIELRAK